jgi:DNA-binding beta-propeller fold protein YncE/PKD repeat protein
MGARGRWCAPSICLTVAALLPSPAGAAISVYVGNDGTSGLNGVSQFDIGAGGALSPKSPATAPAGPAPQWVATSPDGKSVYVVNLGTSGPDGISQFDVGAGGVLSPKSAPAVSTPMSPQQIAVSPNGKSVYMAFGANGSPGGVAQFNVGVGGKLSPKATPTVAAGDNPFAIAISPNGKSVYVADINSSGANGVSQFDVGAGGELSPKATPAVTTGSGPDAISVSPNGKSVYVANGGGASISQFDVRPGGTLSPKATPTVADPASDVPVGITVSPDGKSVYLVNVGVTLSGIGSIAQFDVGPGGALSPLTPATVAEGNGPFQLALTPDSKSAYVVNSQTAGAGGVSQYDVASDGTLTPKSPNASVPADNGPQGLAVSTARSPTASFSATPATPGSASHFDGSGSSAHDGTVARFDWNFGDGGKASNGGAMPSHTYARAGIYTVTLTVTDSNQCSVAEVYTGQTASCSGSPKARTKHKIRVGDTTTRLTTTTSASVKAGGSITDRAALSGGMAPTGTITFMLYGPGDRKCSGAVAATSQETVTGNGSYTSDPATPSAPGVYRWRATYSGDVNNVGVATSCRDVKERVVVTHAPPVATTGAASGVTSTEATLNGKVNPNGAKTKYHFDYGTSTAYGTSVPSPDRRVGSVDAVHALSRTIKGLRPGTTYHFRIVATSSAGVTLGRDRTFRTVPRLAPNLGLSVSPRTEVLSGSDTDDSAYRYTARGSLDLPTRVTRSDGCHGEVTVKIKLGTTTVMRTVDVSARCGYSVRVRFIAPGESPSGAVVVNAHFSGNPVLLPADAHAVTVTYRYTGGADHDLPQLAHAAGTMSVLAAPFSPGYFLQNWFRGGV